MVLKSSQKASPTKHLKAFVKASKSRSTRAPPPVTSPPMGDESSGDSLPTPRTNNTISSSERSSEPSEGSIKKLNQLRAKYGIKPAVVKEERDEHATSMEIDGGEREAGKKELPTVIDTEKMWRMVEAMTRKAVTSLRAATTINKALLDNFHCEGAKSPFPADATAEEKGLEVIIAFANYKALQANVVQKAIAVQVGDEFCRESNSIKQLKERNQQQMILVGALNQAKKEELAAKSTVMDLWSALNPDDRRAVGGLGEIERNLLNGIETNLILKLGKMSKTFISGSGAKTLPNMAKTFVWSAENNSNNASQSGSGNSATHDTSIVDESLSQQVISLYGKLDDDATQVTSRTDKSSLAKFGFGTLMCGNQDDYTVSTSGSGACDDATDLSEQSSESRITGGGHSENTLLVKLMEVMEMMSSESDDATTFTANTFEGSEREAEDVSLDDNDTKASRFEESVEMVRTTSVKSAEACVSAATSVPTVKTSICSTNSVGTIKTVYKTKSDCRSLVSHADDVQTLGSNENADVFGHASVGDSLRGGGGGGGNDDGETETVHTAATYKTAFCNLFGVRVPNHCADDDEETLKSRISKKSEVVYDNAAEGIEVQRRSNGSALAVFEDDGPMINLTLKKKYDEEIVPHRNFLTHAFIKCDDFFSGIFCCQESVESKLQRSEAEEWNECYNNCQKFLYQDEDDFTGEEEFTAWLNTQEEQVTKAGTSLSKYRVHKLKSLLMPVATEQRRQYEELRFALDDAVMMKLHGIENIDYAITKAAVTEFNKNYYSIMLKGRNHDIIVQQVARIIQGLGFERSLPPRPLTRAEKEREYARWLKDNVHLPIDNAIDSVIDYLRKMEVTDHASMFSYETYDSSSCDDTATEYTKDTNGDTATVSTKGSRKKLFKHRRLRDV